MIMDTLGFDGLRRDAPRKGNAQVVLCVPLEGDQLEANENAEHAAAAWVSIRIREH
jgi:hypothetical protein